MDWLKKIDLWWSGSALPVGTGLVMINDAAARRCFRGKWNMTPPGGEPFPAPVIRLCRSLVIFSSLRPTCGGQKGVSGVHDGRCILGHGLSLSPAITIRELSLTPWSLFFGGSYTTGAYAPF